MRKSIGYIFIIISLIMSFGFSILAKPPIPLVPQTELIIQTVNAEYYKLKIVMEPAAGEQEYYWDSGSCNLKTVPVSTPKQEFIIYGDTYNCAYAGFRLKEYGETFNQTYNQCGDSSNTAYPFYLGKYKISMYTALLTSSTFDSAGYFYFDNRDCGFLVTSCVSLRECSNGNDITLRYEFDNHILYSYPQENLNESMTGFTMVWDRDNPDPGYENGTVVTFWDVKDCDHCELDFAGAPDVPTGLSISGSVGNSPTISWNANTDTDLDGYKLYRSDNGGSYNLLTSLSKNTTSYTDNDLTISNVRFDPQYCYKVSAIDIGGLESGKSTTPGNCIKSDELSKSANESITNTEYKEYKLLPAYPNPSNPSTNISYSIPRNSFVEIKLYDQLGKKIATLYSGNRQQGKYSFTLDFAEVGGGLASGVYIVTMTAENYIESQKINYIK